MEISNGFNFYLIENDTILFWGMDIPSLRIDISDSLRKFISEKDFSTNEVCEFNQIEDFELFSKVFNLPLNELN
jgi:hypothetical protein